MQKHEQERWYALSADEVLSRLETNLDGLSEHEAQARLEKHGPNIVQSGRETSPWTILRNQIASPLIYILLAAMVVTLAIQHWADAIVIGAVVALNTVIGFVQEYRAENAIQALIGLAAPKATVRRQGRGQRVDASELVPGDIVLSEAGSIVPADLRLVDSTRFRVDESLLTGESVPSSKSTEPLPEEDISPADQENMAFMGTAVTSGRATGVVVATSQQSQMGSIAEDILGTTRAETPLQARMKRFGQWISVAIVAASALTFAVGLAIGEPMVDMFLTAVAIAVSAIPEGLPVVMTIALAVSVRRMAGRNAIIRRLPAVETLGSCTVILSDKTGTLTQNQMTVQSIWTGGISYRVTGEGLSLEGKIEQDGQAIEVGEGTPPYLTLLAGLLANESSLRWEDKTMVPQGDPTEVALLVSAAKAGFRKESLLERYHLVDEIPFDPRLKFSATMHSCDEREVTFVKGATERVIEMCDAQMGNEGRRDLNRARILDAAQSMAREGQRVLAMAMGEGPEVAKATRDGEPRGLTFLGLQGMMDPPREEAIRAVAACHRAGIRVVMVTGDNPTTAAAIAQTVGIGEGMPDVRTGPELEKVTDEELKKVINQVSVYARVRPSQKLRLVNILREQGEVIAVTGDGVNDAPALKSAHIGAAMGQSGTDVAKEASEMVLTDDNFASIYAAVEEGRTSFSNIRNATFFLVSSGVGELLSILASLALRLPLPLLPAQILWLNLVTNGVEDVGLAFEPPEEEQFRKPPRDPKEGVLSRTLLERLILVGVVMAIGTLSIFAWERADGAEVDYARVAALTTLVMFQVFHVFNSRSEDLSVFRKNPISNRFLFIGTLLALAVHIGAMYFQPTQLLVRLEPLALDTWIRIVVVALSVIVVVELHKLLRHVQR